MLEEGTGKGSKKNRGEGAEAIRRVVSGSQRREGFQKEGVEWAAIWKAVWRNKTEHFTW